MVCQLCERVGHTAATCYARDPKYQRETCDYCQMVGHTARVCKTRERAQRAENEKGLPMSSAQKEVPVTNARLLKLDQKQTDDLLCDLLPLSPSTQEI